MAKQNHISEAVKALREAEADLLARLKPIQDALAAIEGRDNKGVNGLKYDEDWSPAKKFLYLLKTYQKFLHFRQAAELIIDIEGKGDVKEWTTRLSSGTGAIKANDTIVRFQAGASNQDSFWGSPKWLEPDGQIKPGFEFDPKYLSTYKEQDSLFEL